MRPSPRLRRALLAALAILAVAVPVAGATLMSGDGDPRAEGAAGDRAAAEALVPRPRPKVVEPVAGESGALAAAGAVPESAPPPTGRPGAREISPGAPTDAQIKEDLAALEREQAKVERLLLDSSAPIRQGSGRLIWPVNGPVTSPFGPRWGRLHSGIDIASPGGTAIRAADAGQVALAGPQGGYGNFTCIRHGGPLATCYAHQSRILVRVGDVVSKGDVIGAVGCTGNCTGNHVHFEVRIGGRAIDPRAYL